MLFYARNMIQHLSMWTSWGLLLLLLGSFWFYLLTQNVFISFQWDEKNYSKIEVHYEANGGDSREMSQILLCNILQFYKNSSHTNDFAQFLTQFNRHIIYEFIPNNFMRIFKISVIQMFSLRWPGSSHCTIANIETVTLRVNTSA